MGVANSSFVPHIKEHLDGVKHGRLIAKYLVENVALSEDAVASLKRYSQSYFPMQEDGKVLNASIMSGDDKHADWMRNMDGAFGWVFRKDALVWRGWNHAIDTRAFMSCSLIERKARQFLKSQGSTLTAIIIPKGTPVAVPHKVWRDGDNKRTLNVVKNEAEIILPRNTKLREVADVSTPWSVRGVRVMRVENF